MQALSAASAGLAQKMYEEQAAAAEAAGGADTGAGGASDDGDTVDAEFEEVDDNKK